LAGALKRNALVGLALAGLALSLGLEALHVRAYGAPGASSFCTLTSRFDCTSVALSRYAVIFGLPLPLWGALGFVALGVAAWLGSALLLPLAALAALASVGLLGLELFAVGSICLLCEGVHLVAFALLALAWRNRASFVPWSRDDAALVLLPPLGAMIALLSFLPPYWGALGWKGELPFADGVTDDGAPWIGARSPKLTLEEYTDYLCPHCKVATARTLRRLAAHPSDIRVIRKQFPLARCRAGQPGSCLQVRMADCALEAQRFWQMDRWLFAHADQVRPDPALAAREVGIDAARFTSCVERRETYERAEREWQSADQRKFLGTPTYIVGTKRIAPETVDRWLEQGHAD